MTTETITFDTFWKQNEDILEKNFAFVFGKWVSKIFSSAKG